ncbi:MAG TPA: hypothetical protein PLX15_05450 [Candidatus Woesearchaeota archaeon]|nr:hypothetical protein [Candidatus Woesearchaeota archaeon]
MKNLTIKALSVKQKAKAKELLFKEKRATHWEQNKTILKEEYFVIPQPFVDDCNELMSHNERLGDFLLV